MARQRTNIDSPLTSFGELATAERAPQVQISGIYGIQASDHQTFTGPSGTVTTDGSMTLCTTGTSAGGYGTCRSRRTAAYRPGVGLLFRGTARFSPGVPNSLQAWGAFNASDAVWFGYLGEQFGVFLRKPGSVAIYRLEITVAAAGNETITVTMNGVAFTFATGGALAVAALAQLVAEQTSDPYVGWAGMAPQYSTDGVSVWVHFMQDVPGLVPGEFSFASTGAAEGTFTVVQAGAPNSITEADGAFIPQASWNGEKLDGAGPPDNDSNVLLDPQLLNVYEIGHAYLGAGAITFRVMRPDGAWVTVHTIERPNNYLVTSMSNPTLRVGWIAASLGSTTDIAVRGGSSAAFTEGDDNPTPRNPFQASASISATTTQAVVLAMRVRSTFGGVANQRQILPIVAVAACETNARIIIIRLYINPTFGAGATPWAQAESISSVDTCAPSVAVTAGRVVADINVGSGASITYDLSRLDIRLHPGDTMVVTAQTVSASATGRVSFSWAEV